MSDDNNENNNNENTESTDAAPQTEAPDTTSSSAGSPDSGQSDSGSSDSGPSKEARQMAMFAHLSSLVGFLIPFGNLIAPLIIWQMKKDDPFVDAQGKEAVNFQITVAIAGIVAFILTFVLIGLLLLPIIAIGWVILVIMAGIKANDGENYQYPFALRLIK